MACEDTLKVKNFPAELSDTEKEDFLRHFGAVQVKVITSRAKDRSTAFAMFKSKAVAKNVMMRLHQTVLLNSRLCVEYANYDLSKSLPLTKQVENVQSTTKKHLKTFITKLNSFNHLTSFHQPPPPHLKYNYPKPNRATISNIAHALASVPKFYTQVLHLMNKMNLPPPFSNVPDPPVIPLMDVKQPIPGTVQSVASQKPHCERSSSESEMGSDSDNASSKFKEIIPAKRTLSQRNFVKRPKFIRPNIMQPTSLKPPEKITDIFENIEIQPVKKIQFNVSSECLIQARKQDRVEEITVIRNQEDPLPEPELPSACHDKVEEQELEEALPVLDNIDKNGSVITNEELAANRIEPNDFGVLPVFKNYHPGVPTCRLYIKNIAKGVCVKDLEFIFKKYIDETKTNEGSEFNIKHMTEGRMKGQAFITLDSVELAQQAVKESNGYILKDKPLVVVFAKSAKK